MFYKVGCLFAIRIYPTCFAQDCVLKSFHPFKLFKYYLTIEENDADGGIIKLVEEINFLLVTLRPSKTKCTTKVRPGILLKPSASKNSEVGSFHKNSACSDRQK